VSTRQQCSILTTEQLGEFGLWAVRTRILHVEIEVAFIGGCKIDPDIQVHRGYVATRDPLRQTPRRVFLRQAHADVSRPREDLKDVHRLLVVFVALSAAFCASSMLLLNTIRGAWRANSASELWGNGRGSWGSHWRTSSATSTPV